MSNQILEVPLITLTLPDYLEDLWGHRMVCTVDEEKGKKILSLQGNTDRYCHVEFLPRDFKAVPPRKENLYNVWRLSDWQAHYTNYLHQKREQDRRVGEWNLRKDLITALENGIMSKMPMLNRETANALAIEIITTRNVDAAKFVYGVDITPILNMETVHGRTIK